MDDNRFMRKLHAYADDEQLYYSDSDPVSLDLSVQLHSYKAFCSPEFSFIFLYCSAMCHFIALGIATNSIETMNKRTLRVVFKSREYSYEIEQQLNHSAI